MPRGKNGVSMFTFIGMTNLTMVVNSINVTICDVDRFTAKSVKLIDDKIMTVDRVILGKPGLKLDIHHQCHVSYHSHILTSSYILC